ncbi:glycosyltransferase [Aureliella helgolandensis]|uniref:GalNAc-alpha-(1->4)-GalNAc-alpha-(1->3)-diNAcBac-PP-undecaprenol alpha-1,4-N-acetyl-D-galactosaminyltransferase n=1 Tax=Aureliella helgolandensis TaxID=2527968 RepID=A0A518GFM4_9BACT|nr:glycosyltransferase [Aureliella helgolandensis]QDV27385.1 GalNAc-alpha-(1->4)-GalNAc-alpha-(1->3)-diNAcBac-PP-undecaprenol alpha-1,4-N-acetyl-D-galactosaminyltransferase [Aureliella helgolandensis]
MLPMKKTLSHRPASQDQAFPRMGPQQPLLAAEGASGRRRLALLIHGLHGGGAERWMSELANRWSAQHEVHLVTWDRIRSEEYPLLSSVQRIGLGVQQVSHGTLAGVLANVRRVRLLRKTLRRLRPDLVLSFSDQMNIVSLEATRGLQVPHWISEHSHPGHQRLSPLWERWRKRSYPRCTGCHVLTEEIASYMTRWIAADKFRVIPPAISLPPAGQSLELSSGRGKAGMRSVLYVGRLSEEKGCAELLRAWAEVAGELPDWQLLIAGEGALRDELEQQAREMPRVQFLGWIENPASLYAQADLFVLPSRYEGFPLALLEAMRCGLPCVATRCSSAIEVLSRAGEGVRVVPVVAEQGQASVANAFGALATSILMLAENPALRQQMGHAAQSIASGYSWDALGPAWDAILDA